MNSDFMRDTAGAFARRLCRETSEPSARIGRAHQLAYCRPAASGEMERGRDYVERYAREAARSGLDSKRAESEAWLSYARTILAANEFVYVD